MLEELIVEGLGVIDRAELALDNGCTALTGETGAGKTLFVAALGLLAGDRSDRLLVRSGAKEAVVEGRWRLPLAHPAAALVASQGLEGERDAETVEIVVSRTLAPDGRSGRVRVNGRLASVGLLAELGGALVEIAGQHGHQLLGSSSYQRALLDEFAGEAQQLAAAVADEFRAAADARTKVAELESSERSRAREADVLRYEIAEIEAAGLHPGEKEALQADVMRLEHAEALTQGIQEVHEAVTGERGAVDALDRAARVLARLEPYDPSLADARRRLESAHYEVGDVAAELAGRTTVLDPEALDLARARLDTLAKLMRKYGADETAVLGYLQDARARMLTLETTGSELEGLRAEAASRLERATELANELSRIRSDAAGRLAREMERLLGELALKGARFHAELRPRELYAGGLEAVELLFAGGPAQQLLPLAKVASGGELSRVALALHLLTSTGTVTTMVFDEVDAGVGGEAAYAVGRCLAQLARRSGAQVLVVTHLPQVAAFADVQLRIVKSPGGDGASASVAPVVGDDRLEELSRMLSGLPDSRHARSHARELLETARQATSA